MFLQLEGGLGPSRRTGRGPRRKHQSNPAKAIPRIGSRALRDWPRRRRCSWSHGCRLGLRAASSPRVLRARSRTNDLRADVRLRAARRSPCTPTRRPRARAAHFNSLIRSGPVNQAMMLKSDSIPGHRKLNRNADAGVGTLPRGPSRPLTELPGEHGHTADVPAADMRVALPKQAKAPTAKPVSLLARRKA